MKIIASLLLTILFWINTCQASIDSAVIRHFRQIIKLIKTDNVQELSKLIAYPLNRQNPLPNIKNASDFILYYPTLIDDSFKDLLKQYNDSVIFEHNGRYGLVGGNFSGEIWIDDDGKILGFNYSSKKEQAYKQVLMEKIKKEIYPTVNAWNENVLVAKSERLLIRVDRTDQGLRYVCWSKGMTMKDKPDIILYNGVEEHQGTMGGWTWTFTNGDWTYVVEDAEMCDDPKYCGLFLELSFKEEFKSTIKLKEIK
ncbi:hypothetical protein GALL_121400 [mine drainage metagenome]|uniref:Uncharacterized protein n=1 Tax=mine drainage metagenome TaxID=410659 RepID=A0A1J5SAY0_9ZZZZ